jgi:hypothetical protein
MRRSSLGVTAADTAVAALLAGCGQQKYHYVKNSEHQVYLKVPRDWPQIGEGDLDKAEQEIAGDPGPETAKLVRQSVWSVAYEDSAQPTVERIFGAKPLEGPVVYTQVREIPPALRGDVSLNTLRDTYLPVTSEAREAATARGLTLSGFELLQDEVVTPAKGVRGVHVRYGYTLAGQQQTFDVTALMNDDASAVYKLIVRCTVQCFSERGRELNEIIDSFTVRNEK